ncbi:MAG: hypothetical protein QNJ53_04345 [Pleurocapsa sp. MO_192.B19]|nr:hypothetical protein [Pleurocapsa sp. MO_192.B19]
MVVETGANPLDMAEERKIAFSFIPYQGQVFLALTLHTCQEVILLRNTSKLSRCLLEIRFLDLKRSLVLGKY